MLKHFLHILTTSLLAFALLLVQFPREAVHALLHDHESHSTQQHHHVAREHTGCSHDHHEENVHHDEEHDHVVEEITAGHDHDLSNTTRLESYCPLFQDLLLAYAGIFSVDAPGIENQLFVSAYATLSVAPIQAQVITAQARGPPESCLASA